MILTNIEVAYHRNGVGGAGFHVATFSVRASGAYRDMIAVLFSEEGECAVFDIAELAKGNIEFGHGNSWRGDHFEPQLREAVAKWQSQDVQPGEEE